MIEAADLWVRMDGRDLLREVSFCLPSGELWAVLGENGAGKSTLLRALCGDVALHKGQVRIAGQPLGRCDRRELARRRAVVTQEVNLAFPLRAIEVVLLGRLPHLRGAEGAAELALAHSALREVGGEHLCQRPYPQLSGGERQRVQVARALCQIAGVTGPRCLLLDEPTASLDLRHQHRILEVARRQSRRGAAVLVVLHDLNLAQRYADQVLLLRSGQVYKMGPPEEVLVPHLLQEAFGVEVALVRSAGQRLLVPLPGLTSETDVQTQTEETT